MAGLDAPTAGAVTGRRSATATRCARPVAVVFQGPSLLPPLTVVENVALPLVLAGAADAEARARRWPRSSGSACAELADKLPEEISGGQAQRVAVARALAGRPAADPRRRADRPARPRQRRGASSTCCSTAAEHAGAALVVATHDPAVADRLDERWEMHSGPAATSGAGMVALTWLARAARPPARAARSRPPLGVAVGVALLASIGTFLSSTTSKMTQRATARVAGRLAGRGPAGREPGAPSLRGVQRYPGVQARAAGRLRPDRRARGHDRRLDAAHRARQGARPPRRLRARVPRRAAHAVGPGTGVLLAQQTAANLHARPGDTVVDPARRARAGAGARRRRRRPARRPTRCSRRSARRPARSRRRRPTT